MFAVLNIINSNKRILFVCYFWLTEPDQMSLAEDNSAVFEADGGSGDQNSDEAPPEAEVEADVAFNPVPLKELVQAPNKEDLFGKSRLPDQT